jgi:dihydroxyacid dehydratase/phosphogluconate dehydratase
MVVNHSLKQSNKLFSNNRNINNELNKYSKTITQDETQPAAQAMLYEIGLTETDLNKAQVGIVSM